MEATVIIIYIVSFLLAGMEANASKSAESARYRDEGTEMFVCLMPILQQIIAFAYLVRIYKRFNNSK